MQNKLERNWLSSQGLRLLIILILTLGLLFRWVNLDRKVYWEDEASTSLRVAGYTKIEFARDVFNGQPIRVEELRRRYQYPNSERSVFHTLDALAGKAEHPPLYYLIARFWAQGFGSSIAVMRSLPALISLLAFPGMYWLCLELFNSPGVAWMAVALVTVSPIHVLYAQEAREYSLWTVAILLSSAALLRSLRLKTNQSWGVYAATLALGLYSHLFFGLVAVGQGIYVAATEGWRLSRNAIAYLLASLAGFLAFLPWIAALIAYLIYSPYPDSILEATGREIPLDSLIGKWFRSINRFFHDADLGSANILLVILAGYAIYFVCRHTPKRVWLFIVTLIGVTALTLGLPDLILGGQRSVRTRYLIPCAIGIELAVAYLLTIQSTTALKAWQQKIWQGVAVILITAGIVSCAVSAQAESWWNKNSSVNQHYPKLAQLINQAESPLVISDSSPTSILSLSHELEPNVTLQLVTQPDVFDIGDRFTDVFLFNVSEPLLQRLQEEKNFRVELMLDKRKAKLWKLSR